MLVIVPSRGRPHNIRELITQWEVTEANAVLLVVVDDDDPDLAGYRRIWEVDLQDGLPNEQYQLIVRPRLRLAGTLNSVAIERVSRPGTLPMDIIGFMGDDHRPRTPHWDAAVEDTFADMGHGIVYGNDLLQGPNLPTAVFMTAGMIKTLGYMVPPGLVHMYLDNAWREWGMRLDRIFYLPHVIIEHMHPVAGKAVWDDRYIEVNAGSQYASDAAAFENYTSSRLSYDIERLRSMIFNG